MLAPNTKLTGSLPNQDALIDVALGLGAPLSKLILNMPAFGNSFSLMDVEKNLPGSAVTSSQPSTTTYQQVMMTSIPACSVSDRQISGERILVRLWQLDRSRPGVPAEETRGHHHHHHHHDLLHPDHDHDDHQVCQLLSRGNWTLERDEDLTAPYAFLGPKWLAFDDDTSLKIKVSGNPNGH